MKARAERNARWWVLGAAAGLLLVAGCQPLPRPVQPEPGFASVSPTPAAGKEDQYPHEDHQSLEGHLPRV